MAGMPLILASLWMHWPCFYHRPTSLLMLNSLPLTCINSLTSHLHRPFLLLGLFSSAYQHAVTSLFLKTKKKKKKKKKKTSAFHTYHPTAVHLYILPSPSLLIPLQLLSANINSMVGSHIVSYITQQHLWAQFISPSLMHFLHLASREPHNPDSAPGQCSLLPTTPLNLPSLTFYHVLLIHSHQQHKLASLLLLKHTGLAFLSTWNAPLSAPSRFCSNIT